jgi:PAS domain S-box-containing protein
MVKKMSLFIADESVADKQPVAQLEPVRNNILNQLLKVVAAIGMIPVAASLYRITDIGWQMVMLFHIAGYLLLVFFACLSDKIPYRIKAKVIIGSSFIVGCAGLLNLGMHSSGIIFIFIAVIMATIFLGVRWGGMLIVSGVMFLFLMAILAKTGWMTFHADINLEAGLFSYWLSKVASFAFFSSFIVIAMGRLVDHLTASNLSLEKKIEQIKQAERSLSESELHYEEIFNASNDAIFVHDAKTGQVLDVNQAMLRMYGCTKEQALTSPPETFRSNEKPYDETGVMEKIEKTLSLGPQVFEWQARKFNRELFWVEVNLKASTIGEHERIIAVVRDITEKKKVLEMMIQNEKIISLGRAGCRYGS